MLYHFVVLIWPKTKLVLFDRHLKRFFTGIWPQKEERQLQKFRGWQEHHMKKSFLWEKESIYVVHAHTQKHCQCKLLQSEQKRKQQFRHLLLIKIEAFQSIAAPQNAHPLLSLASFFFSLCYTLILKKLTLPLPSLKRTEPFDRPPGLILSRKGKGTCQVCLSFFPEDFAAPSFHFSRTSSPQKHWLEGMDRGVRA